jgi:hypothetical protein
LIPHSKTQTSPRQKTIKVWVFPSPNIPPTSTSAKIENLVTSDINSKWREPTTTSSIIRKEIGIDLIAPTVNAELVYSSCIYTTDTRHLSNMKVQVSLLALLSAAALWSVDAIAPVREPLPALTAATKTTTIRGGAVVDQAPALIHQKKAVAKAATKKKTSQPPAVGSSFNVPTDAIVGSVAMAMVERVVKKVFLKNGISFPAQLAGCVILFFALLVMDLVVPGSGESLYKALGPGTALLTKWLPVFFVPGLAMLPLAPSVGSGVEVRVAHRVCLLLLSSCSLLNLFLAKRLPRSF